MSAETERGKRYCLTSPFIPHAEIYFPVYLFSDYGYLKLWTWSDREFSVNGDLEDIKAFYYDWNDRVGRGERNSFVVEDSESGIIVSHPSSSVHTVEITCVDGKVTFTKIEE